MFYLIIGIISVILFLLLLGAIASKIPKRFHISIRVALVVLGVASLITSLSGYSLSVFFGIGLITGGLFFMPFKKQLELIIDLIPL